MFVDKVQVHRVGEGGFGELFCDDANVTKDRPADGIQKGAMTAAERARRYRRNLKKKRPDPKTAAKQQRRAEREAALAAATIRAAESLGQKLYGVLYVDPPWDFLVRNRETGMDLHAANHYPVMSLDALAALKLPAAKDCVPYLWATISQLANAQRLIEAWGIRIQVGAHLGKAGLRNNLWRT